MKKKVTLSEQELRRLIRASLLEQDEDTGAVEGIPFDVPLDLNKIGATNEIDYLLEAFNRFSIDDIVISPSKILPTAEQTPKAIKDFLEAKGGMYSFRTPAWPGSGTIEEQKQVAFEYVTLLLKCKIIDLLNDASNQVNPRYVFFIDNAIYRRDKIDASELPAIEKLSSALEINTTAIQFNTPAFFNKLSDKAFVEAISNPASGKSGEGPLANLVPAGCYVSAPLVEKYNKAARVAVDAAVAKVSTLLKQFDTDFVETFFCTPLVFPDVWKKYCFDSDHPLSTPWRQSYVIMNIASQAASVAGGTAALYSKLISYYTQGASVQMGEKVGQQNPLATTNMFRSLQESKKILVTLDELKRVISAALQLHEGLGDLTADALRSAGKSITGIFKRSDVVVAAEAAALSLARSGIIATGRYATEISAALKEIPDLDELLRKVVSESAVDEATARAALIVDPRATTVAPLRKALNAVINPAGAGLEVARVKEVVVDTLVKIASEQAGGKKLDAIMVELIGGGGAAFSGDLSKIQNWSRPLRDAAARMLTQSASNDILTGQGTVSAIAESLSVKANAFASTLKTSLESAASVQVAALSGTNTMSFDLARRQFVVSGSFKKTRVDVSAVDIDDVRAAFGAAGVKLFEDAQRYVKQIDALNSGKIVVGDAQVDIAELFAKAQINGSLTGANDALRSAMISPAIARKAALGSEFFSASAEVSVGIRELDKYQRVGTVERGATQLGLFRGYGGKFGRSFAKASPMTNIFFGANKIVLAEPVRLLASGVRAIAGDTTLIGRLSDTVATSGLYQNLIGLAAFTYIVNTAAGTTPGTRDGGILNALDMVIADGPVSVGIGNFMLTVLAETLDDVIKQSGNAQIAAFLAIDPFAAYQALGDAIKAYYDRVDVNPLQFPDLTSKAVNVGARAGLKTAIEMTGTAIGRLSAVFAGDGDAANAAVTSIKAAAEALDPLITTGAQGETSQGNDAWKQLESSREVATTVLVGQLSESFESSPGGSSSGVASYSSVLTKYYTPTSATATFDPVTQTAIALSAKTIGAEASAGDFAEFFGYFSGSDRELVTLGMEPTGTVTAKQITDINTKLKELGDKFDELKRLSAGATGDGGSTPAPAAP